jgi:hypothetical protein
MVEPKKCILFAAPPVDEAFALLGGLADGPPSSARASAVAHFGE